MTTSRSASVTRQVLQHERMQETEDRSVRANAERQRDHHHDRKRGTLRQRTDRELQLLQRCFHLSSPWFAGACRRGPERIPRSNRDRTRTIPESAARVVPRGQQVLEQIASNRVAGRTWRQRASQQPREEARRSHDGSSRTSSRPRHIRRRTCFDARSAATPRGSTEYCARAAPAALVHPAPASSAETPSLPAGRVRCQMPRATACGRLVPPAAPGRSRARRRRDRGAGLRAG